MSVAERTPPAEAGDDAVLARLSTLDRFLPLWIAWRWPRVGLALSCRG